MHRLIATLFNMNTFASWVVFRQLLSGIAMLCFASLAQAQWSWKDAGGSRVFSDQPPPPSVAEKDILKRPPGAKAPSTQGSEAAASTPTTTTATTATAATAPKISGKDAELEKKKKEIEAKEAAKKQAEGVKVAAAKKDNCERAKRSKASYDSGVRVSTTNAKGEREIMDEAMRASEAKRLQEIIASECS